MGAMSYVGPGRGEYAIVEHLQYVGEGKGDVAVPSTSPMPALSPQPCSTVKVDKEKLCAGFYKFAIVSIVVLLILGTICALIPYGKAASTYFDGSARSPSGKANSGSQFRGHRASVQAL